MSLPKKKGITSIQRFTDSNKQNVRSFKGENSQPYHICGTGPSM